jgi:hypothetical protein
VTDAALLTGALKFSVIVVPVSTAEVIRGALGVTPSITKALFAASEFAARGDASVSVAFVPGTSVMLPPFREIELVVGYVRSLDVSPGCTV